MWIYLCTYLSTCLKQQAMDIWGTDCQVFIYCNAYCADWKGIGQKKKGGRSGVCSGFWQTVNELTSNTQTQTLVYGWCRVKYFGCLFALFTQVFPFWLFFFFLVVAAKITWANTAISEVLCKWSYPYCPYYKLRPCTFLNDADYSGCQFAGGVSICSAVWRCS